MVATHYFFPQRKMASKKVRAVTWNLLIGALFLAAMWAPQVMVHSNETCLPPGVLRVTTFHFPPYVITEESRDNQPQGIAFDFIHKVVTKCYKHCQNTTNFTWNVVNSEQELYSAIVNNKTDIGFPILKPLMMKLSDSDEPNLESALHFHRIIVSPSLSFIIDAENFKANILTSVLESLFHDIWPLIVCILLLGGISGILVWILVCSLAYFSD